MLAIIIPIMGNQLMNFEIFQNWSVLISLYRRAMTTALQQDFGIEQRFSDKIDLGELDNMCASSDSSASSNTPTMPNPKESSEESHVYANIREIEEFHNRAVPPAPKPDSKPVRDMHNGWLEYETDLGRTFFYHKESGKTQWIPPRFLRTPAQVEQFLHATKTAIDENCTYEGPSTKEHKENKENEEAKDMTGDSEKIEDEEVFDEVCEDPEEICSTSGFVAAESPSNTPTETSFPAYAVPPNSGASSPATTRRRISPNSQRMMTFQNRCFALKNVPLPQVLPTSISTDCHKLSETHEECENESTSTGCQKRRGSSESREPVRTIRYGDMEWYEQKEELRTKKREWISNYMYLTSAHLIMYKDQKSAEKHGKHYDAPMGCWDLRGANVSWVAEKDVKKKKRYIQLELCNNNKYLLRFNSDNDANEWFSALNDVVSKLPAPDPSVQPVMDVSGNNVSRSPSYINSRPLSHLMTGRSIRRRGDPMSQSAIESSSTAAVVEESRPSKESILEKLRRFFAKRPTVESLKEKGIYKPEPVFGSTLLAICNHENSYVPKFLRVITEVIESKGLDTDGIYRVSGNLSAVQRIRCQADQDNYKALVAEEDIHVLTGALKLFFRELSEPLFPTAYHKEYTSAMQNPNVPTRFKKFEELLNRLPMENRETLKVLLRHLNRVASHSSHNRMQQHNLAIVFGPTLFHNGDGVVAGGAAAKNKKAAKRGKNAKGSKDEAAPPVQSNSHLAFSMIMQSQIVQYLLESQNKFDILKAPVIYSR
ncbi:unnamed protein product [Caenorhabditis bovis]|uniref:Uncharacterized protein n=1 Tax=Caenorhabditis bovis TaxID=2654633 RepID=A0A8S1EQD4_9PELO|nr:unnamed protein product [Caenorhabditis bovis]